MFCCILVLSTLNPDHSTEVKGDAGFSLLTFVFLYLQSIYLLFFLCMSYLREVIGSVRPANRKIIQTFSGSVT